MSDRGAGGAHESERQQRRRSAQESERRHGCRGAKERANGDTGDGVTNACCACPEVKGSQQLHGRPMQLHGRPMLSGLEM